MATGRRDQRRRTVVEVGGSAARGLGAIRPVADTPTGAAATEVVLAIKAKSWARFTVVSRRATISRVVQLAQ